VLGSFQLQQITTDLEPDEETLLRFLRGELRYKVKMLLLELDKPYNLLSVNEKISHA
jgi:hypothetical protein